MLAVHVLIDVARLWLEGGGVTVQEALTSGYALRHSLTHTSPFPAWTSAYRRFHASLMA